jgi:hypothetical protein
MVRRILLSSLVLFAVLTSLWQPARVEAAGRGQPTDWNRFYYYPYVYYPQNFQPRQGSYDHMYYRYSQEQRIPVYNKNWYNPYPSPHPYHKGHHFILDVF